LEELREQVMSGEKKQDKPFLESESKDFWKGKRMVCCLLRSFFHHSICSLNQLFSNWL